MLILVNNLKRNFDLSSKKKYVLKFLKLTFKLDWTKEKYKMWRRVKLENREFNTNKINRRIRKTFTKDKIIIYWFFKKWRRKRRIYSMHQKT